jgi:hypothetical protein
MSDTILTMANGSKWKPSTSQDLIHCASCDKAKGVRISVTAPEAISGEA